MKYLTFLLHFGVLIFLTQVAFCGDEDRLFYDAVRAEASGNLDQAIDYYLKASKISHSANLYGNLANLFFKKEQFGLAILYFRKALLLQPRNRELATNLAFAYEMAKIPKSKEGFKGLYFSENTISLWCLFCTLVFWTGLLLLIYLFFFKTNKLMLFNTLVCWAILLGLGLYATNLSLIRQTELSREVVAHIAENDKNNSGTISLRRFAGETNSENTTVIPGECLIISLDKDENTKQHKSSDGINWFLVRSKNGNQKGWIREDEFGWIINPDPRT